MTTRSRWFSLNAKADNVKHTDVYKRFLEDL